MLLVNLGQNLDYQCTRQQQLKHNLSTIRVEPLVIKDSIHLDQAVPLSKQRQHGLGHLCLLFMAGMPLLFPKLQQFLDNRVSLLKGTNLWGGVLWQGCNSSFGYLNPKACCKD